MAKVETVKVKANNDGGFVVINKTDLTNEHTIWPGKKETPKPRKGNKKNE